MITAWPSTKQVDLTIKPADPMVPAQLEIAPPRDRTVDHWYEVLRQLGPWSGAGGLMGLTRQLHATRRRKPDILICVGLDQFAPYPDRSTLLVSFPDDVVLGTQMLADIFGAADTLMLAPKRGTVINRLKGLCRHFRVPLLATHNVYPSGDPALVMTTFAPGRRRLRHGDPLKQGVILIEPWTAIRIARWMTRGQLDLARPMMIGWPDPNTPLTPCYALPGQPLASLHGALAGTAAAMTGRVVIGNPMTGQVVTTPTLSNRSLDPVVPTDELLLSVLSPLHPPAAEACIACGWCTAVCPTALRPVRLMELAQNDQHPEYLQQQLRWCIGCGLCSHVCPSRLPLSQTFREVKAQGATMHEEENA